jgi:hypothetical protein
MRSAPDRLPSSLAAPRISARAWLALAAGVGCAACAYAGLYPRFDDGKLRVVLALTSAPFGAAVVAAALGATSAARAFWRTLFLAALLGMASIVLPAAILSNQKHGDLVIVCLFGFLFGAPTGLLYGIPLAILAADGHRHVQTATHVATDRAARAGGCWLIIFGLVALVGTQLLDTPRTEYDREMFRDGPASFWPSVVACMVAFAGVLSIARAMLRSRSRSAWLARVRAGLEPAFGLRPADSRDPVGALPRIGEGTTVVEWYPEDRGDATAYRTAASGVAVALVEDGTATTP